MRRCPLLVSARSLQVLRKKLEGIQKLQSIHSDDYDYGQYRLWARMIKNNQWKDFNNPPNLPKITGKVSRKDKSVTVVDTLATAAVAIIKELKDTTTPANKGTCTPGGMSPGKVELRSQYLKQRIQNLKDEGVLTLEEFQAEDTILQTLKPRLHVLIRITLNWIGMRVSTVHTRNPKLD